MNKLSAIFRPTTLGPVASEQSGASKSHKLMIDLGLVQHAGNGLFNILPLAHRSLRKLEKLIDCCMASLGAQKMTLPLLTRADLWKTSGTFLQPTSGELFTVRDRNKKEFVLSPTHEEAVTNMFCSESRSYKNFPLLLYQVGPKFRDELRPKYGLIRGREFFMKDLYSIHTSIECARATYDSVAKAYTEIFRQLNVDFVRAEATKDEKINVSHEFHYICDIGDDKLLQCNKCDYVVNQQATSGNLCPQCFTPIQPISGIEVGHTFSFGTWYSDKLGAKYRNKNGTTASLFLCSYGIGLTRLIAATLECLSTETELRWPLVVAPYTVCIIPPKKGSRESEKAHQYVEQLYRSINELPSLNGNVILDDRTHETIGRRLIEDNCLGFPYIVVIGRDVIKEEPLFELYDVYSKKMTLLSQNAILEHLQAIFKEH